MTLKPAKIYNNFLIHAPGIGDGMKLSDNLDETKSLSVFFNSGNRLSDLKQFVTEIENAAAFEYTVVYSNPLSISNHSHVPESLLAYEKEHAIYRLDGEEMAAVNALQITYNINQFYPFIISEGREFVQSDFLYDDNKNINILLGNSYRALFNIGDQFSLSYWSEMFTAKVVGFLDSASFVMKHSDSKIALDNYIVVPFLNCESPPMSENEHAFQAISYTSRMNGIAFPNKGFINTDVVTEVERLCKKYDIPSFGYEGLNSNHVRFWGYILQLGPITIRSVSAIVYVICFFTNILFQSYLFKKNKHAYKIHVICSASRFTVFLYSFLDTLFCFALSHFITYILFILFSGTFYFSMPVLLLSLPLLLCTTAYQYVEIYKK